MNIKNLLFSNNSNRQVLAKNTFWLGLNEVFSKLIMFLVTVSVGRYLGIKGFGSYNFIFSYVGLLMIFSDLGLSTVLTRDIAKHKNLTEQYIGNALSIRIFTSIFILILMLIYRVNFALIILVTVYNLILQFNNLISTILVAYEKMEFLFITKMVYYIGILIISQSVIKSNLSVFFLLVGYILISLITISSTIVLVKNLRINLSFQFNRKLWQQLLFESLPLFGFIACSQIYLNFDTLFVGKVFGDQSLGIYSAAYKILYAFQSINLINSVTFPRISVLIHENKYNVLDKLIKIIIIGSLIFLIPIVVFITLNSSLIVHLIWAGEGFSQASIILPFFIWSGVINYFRIFATNLLVARSLQKYVFYSMLAGLLTNILLNLSFTFNAGFQFAATSLLISESVILIVSLYYLYTIKPHLSVS